MTTHHEFHAEAEDGIRSGDGDGRGDVDRHPARRRGGQHFACVKEALPTINRSLIDIVRTNPYFNAITTNNTVTAVSVAGRNARYNSIQIDGAVNNDLFGLAETGTPGGQTEAQPISLDAIAQIQLVVSPYDVRQGGFSGGGINAVTKSGANQFSGTAFLLRPQPGLGRQGRHGHADRQLLRQAGRVQRRRADRRRTRRSSSATPTGAARRRRPASASRAARSRSVAPRRRSTGSSASWKTSTATRFRTRGTSSCRTTNSDKFLAQGGLQPEFQSPPDGASQLRERPERHRRPRAPRATSRRTATTGSSRRRNGTVAQLNSTFGNAVNEFRVAYTRSATAAAASPSRRSPFPRVVRAVRAATR